MKMIFDVDKNKDEEMLDNIKEKLDYYRTTISKLEKEITLLKSPYYKDTQIELLNNKIKELEKNLISGFPIYEQEEKKIENFQNEHLKKCKQGYFSYIFHPISGIGVEGVCRCEKCGEKFIFCED